MNKFAENLKYLRKCAGISQFALAEQIGVTQTAIAKWESGEREPSIDLLIAIAKFFDCTLDYLIGLED